MTARHFKQSRPFTKTLISRHFNYLSIGLAYKFAFDLTGISRSFFREIAKVSEQRNIHRKLGSIAEHMMNKFNLKEATGLPLNDAVTLLNDMVDIYAKNLSQEEDFRRTEKRALLLPHCARKYMDNRCQAKFDPQLSTYRCQHCSQDCLISQGVEIGESHGYDVYVLPGGSCIHKLLIHCNYDGIVGVACPNEIQLGMQELDGVMPFQAVPLLRNGCSNTKYNPETLEDVLINS